MASYQTFPLDIIEYQAKDMQLYTSGRTSGVYSLEQELETVINGGMSVRVKQGRAWISPSKFKGMVFANLEDALFPISTADGALDRKDWVIIRYDVVKNETYIYVKKGTPSTNPLPPSPLERTGSTAYELAIAEITIPRGTLALNQSHIKDLRMDSNLCGLMRDGVTGIPTDMLYREWNEWFSTVKDQLTGDVAGNLQTQITKNKNDISTINQDISVLESNSIKTQEGKITLSGDWIGETNVCFYALQIMPNNFFSFSAICTHINLNANGTATFSIPIPIEVNSQMRNYSGTGQVISVYVGGKWEDDSYQSAQYILTVRTMLDKVSVWIDYAGSGSPPSTAVGLNINCLFKKLD